jgi:hypothetical protein
MLRQQGKETEAESLFKEAIFKAPVQYKEQLKDISLQRPKLDSKAENKSSEKSKKLNNEVSV